jgi:hypothetical protein
MDACTACSRAVDLISTRLLKRRWENSRRLVDEPLSGLPHVVPAEHSLRVVAVHYVATTSSTRSTGHGITLRPSRGSLGRLRRPIAYLPSTTGRRLLRADRLILPRRLVHGHIRASTAAAASAHRSSAARSTAASEINRVIQPSRSRAWCRALSNRSNSRSECTLRGYEYLGGLSVPFGTDDRRLLPDRADEARAPCSGYKAADRNRRGNQYQSAEANCPAARSMDGARPSLHPDDPWPAPNATW